MTFVSGPAGSGKTALLAQWYHALRDEGHHPAWLSIGVRGGDESDLKGLVLASVSHSHSSTRRSSASALSQVEPNDRLVFIDDIHHVDQRVVDELLFWFSELHAPRWRLVLASRAAMHLSTPSAPDRTIRSIGPDELWLDDMQVRLALDVRSPGLSDSRRSTLVERVDGWAAGVELVAAQERSEIQPELGIDDMRDGDCPRIADYFEQEVLSGLPLSDQDFLIWSSVLAAPSVDSCDQIAGDNYSAERLSRLARQHAFLYPSADGHGYSWVPLGREFLLSRLRSLGGEHELRARRRLQRWCLSQGKYDEAVTQAVETEDWYAIVDLALEAGLHVIGCGRADDLVGWLEQLPIDFVEKESGVAAIAAMAHWVASGDEAASEIDRWLSHASKTRRGRPPCQAESLSGAIDVGRAAFSSAGPRTRKLFAERALRLETGAETAWTALAHAAAGMAAFLDDEPRAARRALTKSLEVQTRLAVEPRRWISRLFSPSVLGVLALIEIEAGDHNNRGEALISAAELQSHGAVPGAEIVTLARSRVALATGDRQEALRLALETAAGGRLAAFRALGYLDAAGIYCEQGDAEMSASCLGHAERLLQATPDSGRLLSKRRRAIERQVQLGRHPRSAGADSLTEREVEVLSLLETDLSRREIAQELYLSFETVKTYVQRLYQKLGVSSRAAAVATAYAWGWLDETASAMDEGRGEIDEASSASSGSINGRLALE
ncbi:MAG: LuxR C-terminal-related transcriptional regulator [Acidimicrobiales bacterium]